ncbi:MAG TPA: hypothetical protein DHV28_01590 [Ignavibacteriales bacterium]|nr:hypothetical protein [Ignavibacteriales bacterium]
MRNYLNFNKKFRLSNLNNIYQLIELINLTYKIKTQFLGLLFSGVKVMQKCNSVLKTNPCLFDSTNRNIKNIPSTFDLKILHKLISGLKIIM